MNRRLSDQFQLRLPDGMRDRIKISADANDRSMNAEIIARLEDSLDPADVEDAKGVIAALKEELHLEKRRNERLQNMYEGVLLGQQQMMGEFQRVVAELRRVHPPGPDDVLDDEDGEE